MVLFTVLFISRCGSSRISRPGKGKFEVRMPFASDRVLPTVLDEPVSYGMQQNGASDADRDPA